MRVGERLIAWSDDDFHFFGDDDQLYLMEDMATGEIRLSILWEWLHKKAAFTEADPPLGVRVGDVLTPALFERLLAEEYAKLQIVDGYVTFAAKCPWYVDLLNLNIDNADLARATARIGEYLAAFERDGTRTTENLDFTAAPPATKE